jgi:hypothetical protein
LSAGLSDDDDNDNKHKGTNYYESVTATNIQKHLAKLFATVRVPYHSLCCYTMPHI